MEEGEYTLKCVCVAYSYIVHRWGLFAFDIMLSEKCESVCLSVSCLQIRFQINLMSQMNTRPYLDE